MIPQSRFKGVSWHRQFQKWQARYRGKHLGYFKCEENAAAAYLDARNSATLNLTDADKQFLADCGVGVYACLTTEQLLKLACQTVKQMTPKEKATLRQQLEESQQSLFENESSHMPVNYTLEWMRRNHVPLTKENYLQIEFMGQEIPEGAEADVPPELP